MEYSLFYSNQYPQVMVLLDYTAGRCCLYRAMVRNELPISGLDSTDVYIYKGALLPVELSRRHPQIVVHSTPGLADHTYLDIVATLSVQAICCQMVHSLFYSTEYSQAIAYMTTRLGAVAFTVLWCE